MKIETSRLILRPLLNEDIDDLQNKIYGVPETMQYIIGNSRTREETQKTLTLLIEGFDKNGFGFLAVEKRTTREFIGIAGIDYLNQTTEIQVGYLFEKESWGRGLATEVTKELIAYGFRNLKPEKIVAITQPQHSASIKVLEKCGLKFIDKRIIKELEFSYYQIKQSDYLTK